ncbi:hypothetical protein N0V93_005943 [Gnomoniopsis smithogilvyi]|uniref:BZIP domain-containing protein n=1 Tax=Gnomoniopsis smithogilvyi TaxID=1191159 RepID=A0A9W8YVN4_9PEZI|nr:hypothetical protein N0V93_005943 [Gnomoniopsis smithogilvyi]
MGAVLTLQEWTQQQPQQAARRVSSQGSSDDQADSSSCLNLDLSLYHQSIHSVPTTDSTTPTPTTSLPDHHLSHLDLLSPDLWSQHFGSIAPAIDHAGTLISPNSTLGHDLMTFGQTWADSGAGFGGGPSLNDYDFSFDPALIDSLPESIPDFWLVPPPSANTTDAPQTQQQHEEQHQSQQQLDPPPGNSRAGAGRASKRDAEDPDVVVKRQRNTIAARKYRQKRLDRIQELEDALKAVTGERDELKLQLARQEAETAALREMMQMKSGKGSD